LLILRNSLYIVLLVFVCYANNIHAAYRAGEISYRWLQAFTYEITYCTYTDNIPLPDNKCRIDSICFGDGTNGSLTRINGNCNGACSPYCDGDVILQGVRMNVYKITHTYPSPGNYRICFIQGNRSSGIANIPNSGNTYMSLESYLVISAFTGPNMSPVFSNYPITAECVNGTCLFYNAGATDSDGDSLAYKLIAYANMPGFSWPPASSGTFSVNPLTGILSWCNPPFSGDFNVCIRTEEWRNNAGHISLIGYVDRDTEFRLGVCTGLNETQPVLLAEVYPNPANEAVTVTLREVNTAYTIELTDLTGRNVKTLLSGERSKEQPFHLNLDGLDSGIYFLTIAGNHQTLTKKLIKQ
jgi:hypothetical protein